MQDAHVRFFQKKLALCLGKTGNPDWESQKHKEPQLFMWHSGGGVFFIRHFEVDVEKHEWAPI